MNADDVASIVFWIVPMDIGSIPILLKATSTEAQDSILKYITVEVSSERCKTTELNNACSIVALIS